jgi:dUTPase
MTPRGYSSIITGSLMNPRPEFDIIPGIVNTDYYHTLNVIMNVLTDKEFYISQGTPIAQVTFFKRSDNVSKMYVGGDSVFRTISTRGFGGPLAPLEDWRRGKYRREQRKWD